MAIIRVVRPELLDELPPGDPEARRSRADLRLINFLMGNTAWVARQIGRFSEPARRGVAELGAGEGDLLRVLRQRFTESEFTGYDRVPRPSTLPVQIGWRQGDLFEKLPSEGGIALGVMIAHHFSSEQLAALGRRLAGFEVICFCEPSRSRLSHALGWLLRPAVGRVTRHDLHVSVDAGFRRGELARLLGVENWRIEESVDLRGSLRFVAHRK